MVALTNVTTPCIGALLTSLVAIRVQLLEKPGCRMNVSQLVGGINTERWQDTQRPGEEILLYSSATFLTRSANRHRSRINIRREYEAAPSRTD
jgi:hypothetical protein